MCAPVAVAMPMPAKLPITKAKIDSFCAPKMPVAARIDADEAKEWPKELAAEDVEDQDAGDEAEAGNGEPALAPVPTVDQPTG